MTGVSQNQACEDEAFKQRKAVFFLTALAALKRKPIFFPPFFYQRQKFILVFHFDVYNTQMTFNSVPLSPRRVIYVKLICLMCL